MIWLTVSLPILALVYGIMLVFLHGAALLRKEEERLMNQLRKEENEKESGTKLAQKCR